MSMGTIPQYDPDEARPIVRHDRDLVVEDGVWEQDYRFLDYDFEPAPFSARAYFDEPGTVVLMIAEGSAAALEMASVPVGILHYLQFRFDRIDVSTPAGRRALWTRP